jgi:mannose-6-phosphate isomerase-like protein (cupin superfamily)
MDIAAYISSGILHEYCLGTLSAGKREAVELVCARYPEVARELQQLQQAIGEEVKKEKAREASAFPLINKYSDHNEWKRIVSSLMPEEIKPGLHSIVLRRTEGVRQQLIISTVDVPPEMHELEYESFLILEGECTCYIGGTTLYLGPGSFVDVPLQVTHDVKVRSPYVVAVLQHQAI